MRLNMPWQTFEHSIEDVNAAGKVLVRSRRSRSTLDTTFYDAIAVIDNWRAVHAFPLNTFQMYLRLKSKSVDSDALIAQRIKRLSSIEQKLRRMPRLLLSEMQDIGGCRAVVSSVQQVDELVKRYKDSHIKHKLVDEDDYILSPKESGYRSHHLIYNYFSDKKSTYNGRKIEVQLRSRLQHAWATAVETVGTFTRQALKSSQGEKDWLRFFQLMGTVIALKEGTTPVPGTPSSEGELLQELQDHARKLQVENRLSAYGAALRTLETKGDRKMHFYLLALDPGAQTVTVKGYKWSGLDGALKEYTKTEQEVSSRPGGEAVLVSVDSVGSLRSAYPNYFLDTQVFRNELKSALGRVK